MNKLKMFKFYMLTTCVSYTFVILLQTLLFHFNHQNMSNELVVMIFIVLCNRKLIDKRNSLFRITGVVNQFTSIIEIAFVVCTANYLCGYTNSIIELDNFIGVTFMSVTVYFL